MRTLIAAIPLILIAASLPAADSAAVPPAPYTRQQLSGEYIRGVRPSLHAVLRLKANGEYMAQWEGCQTETGIAQGSWSISGDSILLMPATELETAGGRRSLKTRMRQLRIVRHGADLAFVPEPEDAQFRASGVSRYSAFQRPETLP